MQKRVRPLMERVPSLKLMLGLAIMLSIAPEVDARANPVRLGEVATRVHRNEMDVPIAFRAEVEKTLGGLDLSNVRSQEAYVLSATLVKMDTQSSPARAQVTCEVSAILRGGKGGDLRAVMKGRATVEDQGSRRTAAEVEAMSVAVHNALRRLPEVVR